MWTTLCGADGCWNSMTILSWAPRDMRSPPGAVSTAARSSILSSRLIIKPPARPSPIRCAVTAERPVMATYKLVAHCAA